MRLSPNFTLAEMIYSRTAAARGFSNAPPNETLELAAQLARDVLQPIRDRWGVLVITSGYRCGLLNSLVSKDPNSDHIWTADRCAADVQPRQAPIAQVFNWLRKESGLPFDYIILERGKVIDSETDDCIHISFCRPPRRLAFTGATSSASGFTRVAVT